MAAKFCSQCGHEVPSMGRYCSNCAAPLFDPTVALPSSTASHASRGDAGAGRTRQRALITAFAVVLCLFAVVIALLANRINHASLLASNTPQPTGPTLITAPPTPPIPGPSLVTPPPVPHIVMPPEVANYVKFLQGIELRRQAIRDDLTAATGMLAIAHQMQSDQNDPDKQEENVNGKTNEISKGYSDYTERWQALIHDFRTMEIPPPCHPLAGQYLTFLTGYVETIGNLQVAILNKDLTMVGKAQSAQKVIDANALQADGELQKLCASYGTLKPFTIQADDAGPSLLGQ